MHPIIELKSISKIFGQQRIVADINLHLKQGEFFSILGPSGCGKTTLLRMIAGLEHPSTGTVLIDAQDVTALPAHHRPVNMVFQNYALFPHKTVRQNIEYGLRTKKWLSAKRNEAVEAMLALTKLIGYGDRSPAHLSGGECQRVALARALILHPKVLLLDEPLAALDAQLRASVRIELRRIQKSLGITFIMVTHDQEEALSISDRIAIMNEGEILQVDTPSVIYERPSSRFAADFIGTMNFFEGRVGSRSGSDTILHMEHLGDYHYPQCHEAEKLAEGQAVTLGIRPERIRLGAQKPETGDVRIKGLVQETSFLGDRSHYHIQLEGSDKVIIAAPDKSTTTPGSDPAQDRNVWISWANEHVALLPDT